MIETFWFCAVAAMLAAYVLLDGFDLGAGILHLIVARTGDERRQVLRSIGPVWDGNEVWLVAAGGTLYLAFPKLYATSFSGFYLPLMIALWLLMLRGISLEFRSHLPGPVWGQLWDVVFSASSGALALCFGAALGNVVRGVPLDGSGRFFSPLWTDFGLGTDLGILDWYTATVSLAAFFMLASHGALWILLKTEGEMHDRARRAAALSWNAAAVSIALVSWLTFRVQPMVATNLTARPWLWLFPVLAVAGILSIRWFLSREAAREAFLGSCLALAGLIGCAAAGLYPFVLPSRIDPAYGLTVQSAAAPAHGLRVGMIWWIPGIALACLYFVHTYRRFAGKVGSGAEGY